MPPGQKQTPEQYHKRLARQLQDDRESGERAHQRFNDDIAALEDRRAAHIQREHAADEEWAAEARAEGSSDRRSVVLDLSFYDHKIQSLQEDLAERLAHYQEKEADVIAKIEEEVAEGFARKPHLGRGTQSSGRDSRSGRGSRSDTRASFSGDQFMGAPPVGRFSQSGRQSQSGRESISGDQFMGAPPVGRFSQSGRQSQSGRESISGDQFMGAPPVGGFSQGLEEMEPEPEPGDMSGFTGAVYKVDVNTGLLGMARKSRITVFQNPEQALIGSKALGKRSASKEDWLKGYYNNGTYIEVIGARKINDQIMFETKDGWIKLNDNSGKLNLSQIPEDDDGSGLMQARGADLRGTIRGGGARRKITNKRKTNKRKRKRTNKRKTNKRKTNKRKTNNRKRTNKRKL
jgi:hypothetical protein